MERAEAVTMGAAYSVARRPVGDIAATPRRTVTDTLLINWNYSENSQNPQTVVVCGFQLGGRYRTRTCDPLHVKQVL